MPWRLILTALAFMTNDDSFQTGDPFTRDRLRGFRLKADGDWADSFLGINQVNVTFSQGIHGLGSTDNPDPNVLLPPLPTASTKAGRVDFDKIEGTFARTQPLFAGFSAFVAAYGQYAFTPLLISEQCSYGGRFFGRAFDPSQMLGDHCWMALGEVRYDIPNTIKELTKAQLYAYADHGEGFCAIHDVAIAIRQLQREGRIERASVVDLDVHQGNGTARIFRGA